MELQKISITDLDRSITDKVLKAIDEAYFSNSANGNSKNGKFRDLDKKYYRLRSKQRKLRIKEGRAFKEVLSTIQ